MDWSSPLSYLEVAGSFAPLIGAGARQLGKIGVVENAIAKATAVGENVWNSAGQKASDSLRKWITIQAEGRANGWTSETGAINPGGTIRWGNNGTVIAKVEKDGSHTLFPQLEGTSSAPLIKITENLQRDQALSHFPAIDGFARHHMIPISVAEQFPALLNQCMIW
jgi:plastocyanin